MGQFRSHELPGLTLQEVESWHGQYKRMLRWRDRICSIDNGRCANDQLDFLIAFFTACFHLRDWLKDTGVGHESLNALFQANVEMRVCRDIANGFKHSRIDREPFYDSGLSVIREYVPSNWPSDLGHSNTRWSVVAGDDKLDLIELANRCVALWDAYLSKTLCPWSSKVFDPCGMVMGAHTRGALLRKAQGRKGKKSSIGKLA
jgi:hypothetical protein